MLSDKIILSVLIPTTPDRVDMFSKLFTELFRQVTYMHTVHPTLGRIEILVDDSKRFLDGGLSIGKKRESLVQRAKGKYLCFCDSDDHIAPNYLETLVRLCQQDKDVCTFKNLTRTEFYWTIVDMSLEFDNEEANPDKIVKRTAWHVCPVRSLFAKMIPFPDTSYGEDWDWMGRVLEMCSTEAKSNAVLHEYHHGKHSESDKITKHGLVSK